MHTWNTVALIVVFLATFAGSLTWASRGHVANADHEEQDVGKPGKLS